MVGAAVVVVVVKVVVTGLVVDVVLRVVLVVEVVVARSVVVDVIGISVTGSNVEVIKLLSSETSVFVDWSAAFISGEIRSSTSFGI